jgi:hypothetical protein
MEKTNATGAPIITCYGSSSTSTVKTTPKNSRDSAINVTFLSIILNEYSRIGTLVDKKNSSVEFQNEFEEQQSFQIQSKNDCFLNV